MSGGREPQRCTGELCTVALGINTYMHAFIGGPLLLTVDMMGAAASNSCSLDFPTMMDFGLETRKNPFFLRSSYYSKRNKAKITG